MRERIHTRKYKRYPSPIHHYQENDWPCIYKIERIAERMHYTVTSVCLRVLLHSCLFSVLTTLFMFNFSSVYKYKHISILYEDANAKKKLLLELCRALHTMHVVPSSMANNITNDQNKISLGASETFPYFEIVLNELGFLSAILFKTLNAECEQMQINWKKKTINYMTIIQYFIHTESIFNVAWLKLLAIYCLNCCGMARHRHGIIKIFLFGFLRVSPVSNCNSGLCGNELNVKSIIMIVWLLNNEKIPHVFIRANIQLLLLLFPNVFHWVNYLGWMELNTAPPSYRKSVCFESFRISFCIHKKISLYSIFALFILNAEHWDQEFDSFLNIDIQIRWWIANLFDLKQM